jgi:hypothetical protein
MMICLSHVQAGTEDKFQFWYLYLSKRAIQR